MPWNNEDLDKFDTLTDLLSSRDQMERLNGRLAFWDFEKRFTKEELEEMKSELIKQERW